MSDTEKKSIINKYSDIDENNIKNFLFDDNVKNLLYLSTKVEDLCLLKKKRNKWKLKDKRQIISDCKKIKKRNLQKAGASYNKLSKNLKPNVLKQITIINKEVIEKVTVLDSIIDKLRLESTDSDEYIEIFSN